MPFDKAISRWTYLINCLFIRQLDNERTLYCYKQGGGAKKVITKNNILPHKHIRSNQATKMLTCFFVFPSGLAHLSQIHILAKKNHKVGTHSSHLEVHGNTIHWWRHWRAPTISASVAFCCCTRILINKDIF